MKENFQLRAKSAMTKEEVKKLEEGIKKEFLDRKVIVIRQEAHSSIEKFRS